MRYQMPRNTQQNAVKWSLALCALLCVCAVTSGCGYTTATSRLSDDYHTIAVPAFKNKSFEQEIQIRVTNALIRELEADGRFRVVDDPGAADMVLRGAITGFQAGAISYNTDDNIGQFRIALIASAELEDTKTGKMIWRQENLRGTDFYQTLGGRTRDEALDEATENLVETLIYECFDNDW
ncbi:LptE family protein [Candidatus Poribacteria bacterium]|nr:LptE family protein [Candidatus Poribacteria bacterium]